MKNTRKPRRILAASIGALLAVVGAPTPAHAATRTWDGLLAPALPNWTQGGATNWSGGIPVAGDDLQFSAAPISVVNNNDFAAGTLFNSLTFLGAAGPAYTLNGNAITLGAGGISNLSSATNTISFTGTGLTLGASQAWNATSGNLIVTSNVAMGGTTLTIGGGSNTTIGGTITSGAGATLIKNGAGILTINNASSSVTGNVNVNAGQLTIGAAGNLTTAGTVNIGGTANLTGAAATSTITGNLNVTSIAAGIMDYIGVIAGAGSTVTVNNFNVGSFFRLSGNNTYGGLTTVTAGVLSVSNANALGGTGAGTIVQNTGNLTIAGGTAVVAEALTINGAGNAAFPGNTEAALTGGAGASYAGAVTLGSNATIGVIAGGTFTLTGGIIKNGLNLTLRGFGAGSVININTVGISGAAANSDVIIDNGLLTNWNAANTYNGATFIRNGSTLSANVANALPTANGRTALSLDDIGAGSSILNLRVTDQAIRSLSSPVASSTVNLSADGIAHILTIGDTNPTTTTFAGRLTGLGGITKDTNGSTLIISNPLNDYTGPTRVTGGTLRLGNNNVIPDASAVTVTGVGSTLDLQAFSDTVASVLLQSGGQIIGTGTLTSLAPYALEQGLISANLGGAFAPNTTAINKTTAGIVTLTGNNTFTGVTNVLAGVLEAGSNNALGAGGLGNGTIVTTGATLRVFANVNLLTEPLFLAGNGVGGVNGNGALVILGPGASTIGGPVVLNGVPLSTTTVVAGAATTVTFTGGLDKNNQTLVFDGRGGGTFNVNTLGITGATSFTSDFVVNGGVTNFAVANAYAGPTWIGNAGTLNANVLGALPSLPADGGIAAIRTLVVMDPDTLANFPGAGVTGFVPPGSLAPSILNLNANQAIQSLASANTAGIGTNSFVNLNNSTLTIGTLVGTTTFFGVIGSAPAGGVTKDGLSTQILAGNNTYLGLTWVQAGHLQIGNGITGNLNGASAVTVNPAAFLDLRLANNATFANNVLNNGTVAGINTAGNTQTVSGVITGIGNFLQNAGGRTIFTNINTYQGGTAITAASTLQVGNAALQGSVGTGAVSVSGGSFFTLINVNGNVLPNNVSNTVGGLGTVISTPAFAVNTTLSGSLTDAAPGSLTLTQNGAGTTTLTNGGNNYSAGTTVSLGTLEIGNAGNASSAGINTAANGINVGTGGTLLIVNLTAGSNPMLNNITNTLGATGTVVVSSANNNTLAGALTGGANTLALTQSGAGTTTLTNPANNINGTTTVSAGNLTIGTGVAAGTASRFDAAGTSVVTVGTGGTLTLVNLVGNALANNITNTLGGAAQVTVNSGNNNTLSGALTNGLGTLALTQSGAGTTTLTGANTYTGNTLVTLGRLVIGNGATGNLNVGSAVTVNAGAFLDLNLVNTGIFANNVLDNGTVSGINTVGNVQTVSGVISGLGSFAQTGAGTTIFTNVNTFAGGTAITNAGIVQVGTAALAGTVGSGLVSVSGGGAFNLVNLSGNALTNNVSNVVGGTGTVNVNSVNTNTLSGTFTDGAPGTLAFAQNGTGTTILTGVNGYNGGTKVTGGILQVGTAALASSLGNNILANTVAVGTGGTLTIVNLAGGANPLLNAITNNTGGVGTVNVNSATAVTLGGPLTNTAGTLALIQSGLLGTTILTNAGNTYTGGTTVSAGTLQVGTAASASSIGTGVASVGNGATLSLVRLNGNALGNNITNNIGGTGTVVAASPLVDTNTLSGIISNGLGILQFTQAGPTSTTILTGANTYTGNTLVAFGTLQIGNGAIGSINAGSVVAVNATGILDVNLVNGGIFANTVLNSGVVRGINANGTTQTWSGVMTAAGSFAQLSGTNIFTNVNSYSGGTTITGATSTLQIGTAVSAAAAGSGNININGGSTLSIVNVSGNVLSNNLTNTLGGLNGTVLINSALTTTISGSIKDGAGGPLQLTLSPTNTGTTILTNTGNTYTGLTTINAGILQIGTVAQAGSIGGGTPIKIGAGAALSIVNLGNPGALTNTVIQNSLAGIGTLNVNSTLTNTITSQLIDGGLGTLALTQTSTGTTILNGAAANTYTGGTTITAGALQVGNGGAVGLTPLGTGAVTDNALLAFNSSGPLLISNIIGGTGNVSQIGTGTTSLTGANNYSGTTLITAGALSVGNGGAAGALGVGAVTDNASLIFNRSDAHTVANAIGGTGTVTQQGTGITTLTGASNYTGTTTVAFGNLRVNGSLGNTAVTVNGGATLSGTGSIAGSVNILGGGNLNPGTSPGTVTFGSLVLNPLSNSNFELGVPGVIGQAVLPGNDLVNVTGNLTIDGILNVTPIAGFGAGSYRLFNYGGVLTNNIIDTITGAPAGSTIVTGVAGQVNLLVLNAGAGIVQFWDGAGVPNDGVIAGGNGNWDNFQNNFTNAAGTVNSAWQNGTATFGAAAGTVTLTNTINAQGLAFTTTGYVVNGSGGFTLNLVGPAPAPTITVSGGLFATINAQITGASGLTADGAGTLFLTNVGNSYIGGTTINNAVGIVSISNDGNLGASGGGNGITFGALGGTLQATSTFASARAIVLAGAGTIDVTGANTFTESGIISGAAGFALNKTGTGTLNLTNALNSYAGGTVIRNGTLQISVDGNLGNVAGGITFGGTVGNNPILQTLAGIVSARAVTLNASGGTFDTNGFNSTLSGPIGGAAGNNFTKIGAGTLTVTGASTYLGATNVNAGTLQVGDGVVVGSQIGNNTANVVVNNGGALGVNLAGGGNFGNTVTVNAGGSVNAGGANANTQVISGVISGAGVFNQIGGGNTVLTGVNTYTGVTNVNTGTLTVGNGLTGNLSSGTQMNVAAGALLQANLGTGQTLGSNIINAGTINAINLVAITQTLSGVISGAGTFNQTGAGITNLTGASTYIGATNVNAGTLRVNGSLGNTIVTVASGATLGGSGTITGNVTILSGGNLAPGNSAGTLTVGNLVLNAGSNSNYELTTPGVIGSGVNDLVNVTNNLTIDGNLNLTAVAPPFGSGSYRIFNYGGVLTNNIIDTITGVPAGFTATIVTGVLHEVNLQVLAVGAGPALFWDGAGLPNDGIIAGGTGNWDNFLNNWTNAAGTVNAAWQNGTATFGGVAGTVTIVAPINAQNLIFTTSGYVINSSGGFGLNLVAPGATINVLAAGVATINAAITGTAGLTSNGAGTLVLTNVGNTYSGGTTITGGGTVSISSDANLGASGAGNGITFNGGTLQATSTFTLATARAITLTGAGTIDVTASNTLTYGGVASGAGALSKTGTGTLNLTGINLYTGGTNILGGILQVSNDNNLGVGGVLTFANNATLETLAGITSARLVTLNAGGGTIDTNAFTSTFSGIISGAGSLTKIDTGTLILTAVETFTGPLNINGGTVQIGNGVTGNLAAASVVNVNNGGTFAVNLAGGTTLATASIVNNLGGTVTGINAAGAQTISGVISGAGVLNQNGAGTTILTGANTYTGATTVLVGTLQLGNGGLTGSLNPLSNISISAGGTFAFNRSNALTQGVDFNSVISGAGGVTQLGTGTTLLNGANIYSGPTNITAGTLQIGDGITGFINVASLVTVTGPGTLALKLANGGNFGNTVVLAAGTINELVTLGNTNTVSGPISGAGTFNQNGTGTTILNGNNTYTGVTNVNAGELQVGSNTALGASGAANATNVVAGGTLRLLNGINVAAETLNLNGFGTAGSGALAGVAGGTATYGGPIVIVTNASINANGGTLNLNGGITKNGTVLTLNGGAGSVININNFGITGLPTFTSDLVVDGVVVNENVANSYAGPTFITNGGTLNANLPNALPTAVVRTTVNMDPTVAIAGSPATFPSTGSSKLVLGASQAIQSITGTNTTSSVNLNANTLTIGTAAGTTSFSGVISGAGNAGTGAIVKDGASTQILAGNNTYTGKTTVTGGTLLAGIATNVGNTAGAFGVNSAVTVGAAGTLDLGGFNETIGSLSGAVGAVVQSTSGAATLTTGGDNTSTSFAGLIQDNVGPLTLVKTGTGTQTLSGNNTYTGDTFLNAGRLNADVTPGAAGNTAFGTGTLRIAAGTTLGSTVGNETISNNVVVNGNFSVAPLGNNANRLNLTGNVNVGSGNTITNVGPVGEVEMTGVTSGGSVTFAATGALGGFVLGDLQNPANPQNALANTFSGPMTVGSNAGVALAKNDGVTALPGSATVDAGGTLALFANNQIADTATITVNSAGNAALGATFGGFYLNGKNETIASLFGTGTVQLDSTPTGGATAGILTVGSGNFTGAIFDNNLGGRLVKTTSGNLTLSGASTYTGSTNIQAGNLIVNGSLKSNVFVQLGAALAGIGSTSRNVVNGGTFSPGTGGALSVGKFTVGGNYTQTAGGTLVIDIGGRNQGQSDLVAVTGKANLGGTLRLVNVGGTKLKVGDKVTFLTAAGGVAGKFNNEVNPFSTSGTIVKTEVVYGANSVSLEAKQGSFANFGHDCSPNGIAVGRALDKLVSKGRNQKLISFLNGESLGDLCHDLDLIAPEELQAVYTIGISQANVQTANLSRRMDDLRSGAGGFSASGYSVSGMEPQYTANYLAANHGLAGPMGKMSKEMRAPVDNTVGFFATGSGEFTDIGSTNNARGYNLSSAGFTLGMDYRINESFAIGVNLGYSRTNADIAGGGKINTDGLKLGLYATYFRGGFYVDGAVQGGYNTYDTRRAALGGAATGSTDGTDFNAHLAFGYDYRRGGLTVGPMASVQYTRVGFDSFNENGSAAPLTYASQSADSLRTALGAKASYEIHAGSVIIKPEVRAAWQHEFGDSAYGIQSRISNGGAGFNVQGAEIGAESLLLGAGVAVLWNERTSTYVYYDGEIGRTNYQSNNVSGGVRLEF